MKWKKWLENWDMNSLKIKLPYLEMEWAPQEADKNAAWELYIELLTRITSQKLMDDGDEKTALNSIYSIFPLTRSIIKKHGRDCIEFTKIAVIVLNQIIRPFTSKWHRLYLKDAFKDGEKCNEFRAELICLQEKLCIYSRMLADMADVEDLTDLNNTN